MERHLLLLLVALWTLAVLETSQATATDNMDKEKWRSGAKRHHLDGILSKRASESINDAGDSNFYSHNERILLAKKSNEEKKPSYRLPTNVVPITYSLHLRTDMNTFTFKGFVLIEISVKSTTKQITLNSLKLNITGVSLNLIGASQTSLPIDRIIYAEENETVTFELAQNLGIGQGRLNISFEGNLDNSMRGYYRNRYSSTTGEERSGAATQFEPARARMAFPCWDEPAIRANFDFVHVVPKNLMALSNMPINRTSDLTDEPQMKMVVYERLRNSPPYIMAWVIGEFDFIAETGRTGVLIRVFTPVGKSDQGRFALRTSLSMLEFLEVYFNASYGLPKLDLVWLSEMEYGAMENWGLATFREEYLLFDQSKSSISRKLDVAVLVAHELAHMWFGNLVGIKWWTHMWLKEGVATFFELRLTDHFFSEFDVWTIFNSKFLTRALTLDSLNNSHPVEVPIGNPSDIPDVFDEIAYYKGAAIIKMLNDYIGESNFRRGMMKFVSRYSYNAADADDLWDTLAEYSTPRLTVMMRTWSKLTGYPVIFVDSYSYDESSKTATLVLRQQRFLLDGSNDTKSRWVIPLTISSRSSPNNASYSTLFDARTLTIKIPGVNSNDWLKLNVGGVGFYRTRYQNSMLRALEQAIRSQTLPVRDRLNIENDAFALARAGFDSSVSALKVVKNFENETDSSVWEDIDAGLSSISVLLQNTDFHDKLDFYFRKFYKRVMERVGWNALNNENHLNPVLRSRVILRLGSAGEASIIAEAKRRFAEHVKGTTLLPADLRRSVYCIALKYGDESVYDSLLQLYRSADMQEEKVRILESIGFTTDAKILNRAMNFSLSDEVSPADFIYVFQGLTSSLAGCELTWNYIKGNWATIYDLFKTSYLPLFLPMVLNVFSTDEKAVEIENFFKANPAPEIEMKIQQSIEHIRINARQLQRDKESLRDYLSNF